MGFSLSQETTSKMTEVWLAEGTHRTEVRAGYVGNADKHTETGQPSVAVVSVCSSHSLQHQPP